MSALDKIKQEQQDSETLASLTLRLDAVEAHERELTKSVNAMSGFLKVMDEALTAAINQVKELISQQHEQHSQTQLDDETKNRLSEIEKTLSAIAEQLSASGAVKLSDGSTVKRSDLDSYSMMKQLNSDLTKTTSALDELKQVVGNGRTVRVDIDRLSAYAVDVLDQRLSQAVEAPIKRVESTLEGFEHRVASLGTERLSEVHRAVEESLSELNEARQNIEAVERRVTFVGISRLALAVLPLFASLLLVGGLVWGVMSMFGIGPLFGWAWGAFAAASLWWQKALIAAATLGGAALFIWVVLRVSRWVYEELR